MLDLIVRNGTCFIDGNLSKHDIGVQNGKITHIGDLTKEQSSNTINADGKIVFPGLMDTQVHFREPGSVDAEDLHSGSRAAIVGGIGNPLGAFLGGYVIAFAEIFITYAYKRFITYLVPESMEPDTLIQLLSTDYKFAVSFSILVIVLLLRPSGIFKGKII